VLGGNTFQTATWWKGRVPAALVDHLLGRSENAPPHPKENVAGPYQAKMEREAELQIDTRLLQDVGVFQSGGVRNCGDNLQLLMKVQVELSNGQVEWLEILVDTGAEANLVKLGRLPRHLVYAAHKPLKFVTASGQRLEGGDTCAHLFLEFVQVVEDQMLPELLHRGAMFYEADIKVDAILSYPWMAENRIGVFPHLEALALKEPELTLLYGSPQEVFKKIKRHRSNTPEKDCKWARLGKERREATKKAQVVQAVDQKFNQSPGDEEGEKRFLKLAKLGLAVNTLKDPELLEFLDNSEMELVVEKMSQVPKAHWVRRLIRAGDEAQQEEVVEKLREKIAADYEGTVLRDTLIPGLHVRGMFGYAYIPLKDGAMPTRQKPIVAHGEKQEAYGKIVEDWLEKGFIERPWKKGIEWSSAGFAVPKKSADFPWRGVVDLRGPNSQTLRCNYPLPCIEDILVKQGANHIFSILDLKQAFHQQPLHPESRHITCTHTPKGIFQ
jgi:hypothetical protein